MRHAPSPILPIFYVIIAKARKPRAPATTMNGFVLEERRAAFIRDRVNIHFHVWTIDEMSEMFAAARRELALPLEIKLCYADPPNLEVVWVLQKEGTL